MPASDVPDDLIGRIIGYSLFWEIAAISHRIPDYQIGLEWDHSLVTFIA